jgi:hypothetical protein
MAEQGQNRLNRSKWSKKARSDGHGEENNTKLWSGGLTLAILLVVGAIEVNPGPVSTKQEAKSKFI